MPNKEIKKNSLPVNVYTEWAPLKEIVLGTCLNFNMDGFDETFEILYRDNIKNALESEKKRIFKISKQYTVERQNDLDNFAKILTKRGILVRRPRRLDEPRVIRTPFFTSITNAVDSPRDMFLCLGNEIIETPQTNRKRYFEGMLMRDIFMDYFRRGAPWTCAPTPQLSATSIDNAHWSKVKKIHSIQRIETKYDIAFDAANCLKFGEDILMNIGNKNHELGALWLQRHFENKFRIHPVRLTDLHIDGMLVPLRPGLLLINPLMRKKIHLLPRALQKWKIIEAPDENKKFRYQKDHLQLASFAGMSVNVLSLDEKTICIRDEDRSLGDLLEKNKFNVVPVKLRHCELFGGGLHCATLDVRRDEKKANYWK